MARRPIDRIAASRVPAGYEGVWMLVRRHKTFTVADIEGDTAQAKRAVWDYLKRLLAAGYIAETGKRKVGTSVAKVYELVKDCGREAPRLRRDGSPVTAGLVNEHMWRTMKVVKHFTPLELALAASTEEVKVTVTGANEYIRFLVKAGYLVIGTASKPGTQARYRFIKNTGPRPPMIQRVKRVYDPNLRQVVWSPKAMEAGDE
jgi:hypothetical protein